MSTVWLFSGTREELTPEERWQLLDTFGHGLTPQLVVHGDCPTGVDAFIAAQFQNSRASVIAMAAQWKTFGNPAGPRRNSEMVKLVSALVACGWEHNVFAFPRRTGSGTRDLILKAEKAGLSVVVTELGGGK